MTRAKRHLPSLCRLLIRITSLLLYTAASSTHAGPATANKAPRPLPPPSQLTATSPSHLKKAPSTLSTRDSILKKPVLPAPGPLSISARHGHFIGSEDMGVHYCRLFVDGSSFGKELDYAGHFMLHVFLRYTVFQGTVKVKGTASAEPLAPLPPPAPGAGDVKLNPRVLLRTTDNVTNLRMSGAVSFPATPVTIAAGSNPLFVKFTLPPGSIQEFYITSLGANNSCRFNPARVNNRLDPRGLEVPIVKNLTREAKEAYVVMTPFFGMQQHTGRMEAFAELLGRHIQWHRALGFKQHVVYMRGEDIELFSRLPGVRRWTSIGRLLLVLWQAIPKHPALPYYDQRIVYSHAILAFTGLDVYLAMLDLDEYVMSLRDDLLTFQDMSRACSGANSTQARPHGQKRFAASGAPTLAVSVPRSSAASAPRSISHARRATTAERQRSPASASARPPPLSHSSSTRARTGHATGPKRSQAMPSLSATSSSAQPPNLHIVRYHSLTQYQQYQGPELKVWTGQLPSKAAPAQHPLLHYVVVNRLRPPAVKSIVRPEFIRTYNIHYASAYNAFGSTTPDPDCIFILHLKHLLGNRDHALQDEADVKDTMRHLGFVEDPQLEKALMTRAARLDSLDSTGA